MKTFDELKEGDLLLVKYYREEEFAGRPHHKICRAKAVRFKKIKDLNHGREMQVTFKLDDLRLEIYGEQTLKFKIGTISNYRHVTFNAPGGIEICCDPMHGIITKKASLSGEIRELDSLIHQLIKI